MRYVLVCVRDRAADVYGVPYCVGSVGQAIRTFSDEINKPAENNMLYLHPDDFDLFELGFYDDSQAKFELNESPRQLLLGREAVKVKAP